MAKIEVKNINKRFGEKVVLDGIDFSIEQGESFRSEEHTSELQSPITESRMPSSA